MASRLDFSQIRSLYVGTSSSTQVGTDNLVVVGNVGIGTTSPTAKLHVSGDFESGYAIKMTGTYGIGREFGWKTNGGNSDVISLYNVTSGNRMAFFGDNEVGLQTQGSVRLYITAAGNVGIGTTSPSYKLDVNGGSIFLDSDWPIYLGSTNAFIEGNSSGTIVRINGSAGFKVTDGADTRLLIDTNGNVGIGTTSPAHKLDVAGVGRLLSVGIIQASSNSDTPNIAFTNNGTSFTWGTIGGLLQGDGDGALFFNTKLGGSVTEKMRITSAGNVGIGTTAPTEKLVVTGAIRSTNQSNNFSTGGVSAFMDIINGSKLVRIGSVTGGDTLAGSEGDVGIFTRSNEAVRITSAGNVYINSTSMDGKLGINTATSTAYNPNSYNGVNASIRLTNGSAGVGRYTGIAFGGGGSTEAFIGSVQNASELAEVVFQTFNGSAYGERMRMTSAGNVGIGTSAPDQLLVVANSTANVESGIIIRNSHANTSADASLRIDGYAGSFIDFYRNTNLRWRFNRVAFSDDFKISASGAGGVGDVMYFDYDTGNVGIGTTAPSEKLEVVGIISSARTTYGNPSDAGGFRIKVQDYGGIHNDAGIGIESSGGPMWFNNVASGGFYWNDGTGGERMRLTSDGNLGLGLTAPTSKLHIFGGGDQSITIQSSTTASSTSSFVKYIRATTGSARTWWTGVGIQGGTDNSFSFYDETAGSERMRITSAGYVGIGIQNPSYLLDVNGSINARSNSQVSGNAQVFTIDGTNHAYYAWSVASSRKAYAGFGSSGSTTFELINENTGGFIIGTNGSQQLIITSAGNVGIGTTAPANNLHVYNASGSTIAIDGAGGNNTGLQYKSNGSLEAAITYVPATSQLHIFRGGDVMVIGNSNVGIGTTSPTNRLTVTTATNAVDVLRLNNTGGDSGSVQGVTHLAINHFNSGTNPSTRITAYQDSTSGWAGGMYFSTRSLNTDSAPVERMRITSAGNVGIGTTSPQYMLDVNGDAQINAAGTGPAYAYVPDGGFGVDNLITSGTENVALGKPDVWLRIHVDGVAFVFPGYQEP